MSRDKYWARGKKSEARGKKPEVRIDAAGRGNAALDPAREALERKDDLKFEI